MNDMQLFNRLHQILFLFNIFFLLCIALKYILCYYTIMLNIIFNFLAGFTFRQLYPQSITLDEEEEFYGEYCTYYGGKGKD